MHAHAFTRARAAAPARDTSQRLAAVNKSSVVNDDELPMFHSISIRVAVNACRPEFMACGHFGLDLVSCGHQPYCCDSVDSVRVDSFESLIAMTPPPTTHSKL